jgi:shikimate kinase
MKIFLTGYMGSGKSLISQHLSEKMQIPLVDLDDQISLIESQSISEIFESKGELYFRKLESRILEDVLNEPASLIVSLGGGTPCYGINMELIKSFPDAKMVYLKASVGFLTERLFSEKDTRPLISHLTSKDDLEDFIRKHLFERGYYYNQSDIIVDVEDKDPAAIATEILKKLE